MKRTISIFVSFTMLILAALGAFTSCEHKHKFGVWETTKQPTCIENGIQQRSCNSCGFVETNSLETVSHTKVIDKAVATSCAAEGLTEGSHCAFCQEVITPQEKIAALEHTPEKDNKIFPTCEKDGLTEGTHCSVCGAVINAQETIPALEHEYKVCYAIKNATCQSSGTRRMACLKCQDTYDEDYQLEKLNATQIYDNAIKYVGEIVTYTRSGTEYAVGSGIVYSVDGKIITNYHVIDKAYSAKITINDFTYTVRQVLAYDKALDLAVIKIDAKNLPTANICTLPVAAGSTVFTLGSSKGLTNTCSQGIVSYPSRVIDNVTYVQHNAAISGGNSGGPLINEFGEVIGINTMTLRDSQNLNFAIFTSELSKLDYSSPMTLDELYQKEVGTPITQIAAWLNVNGYTNDGYKCFSYNFNTSEEITVWTIMYDPKSNEIAITTYIMTSQYPLIMGSAILIKENTTVFDMYGEIEYEVGGITKTCSIEGELKAAQYNFDSDVTYSSYEGDASLLAACVEGTTSCMQLNITLLATFLASTDLGISIADLGFTSFTVPEN